MSGKRITLTAFAVLTFAALVAASLPRLKTHPVEAATEQTQTASVLLTSTPDIPLEIENATATSIPSGLKSLTYTLFNRGDQRLLAFEITWKLQFANGSTNTAIDRADYAFSAGLAPGASDNMEEGSLVGIKHPSPVQSVTGEITFAEFADGKVLGSNQAKVLPWLKEKRSATLNEYQKLLEIYRSGESALASALVTESDTDTYRGRALRQDMRRLQLRSGINAVEAELNRVASMKLPE